MKKILAISFLLVSTAVTAQSQRPSQGCSVLIGRNWIPMSATSINGCFKFTEAAATPGERQLAAFGSTSLAYLNGQYFVSNNDGASWVNAYPRQAQTVMSSLNKLDVPNEATAAGKPGGYESRLVQEQPVMPAPVPVPPQPIVTGPIPVYSPPVAPVVPATPAPTSTPTPTPVKPQQQTAVAKPSSSIGTSVTLSVCQMKDSDEQWKRFLTATLLECGMKLADATVKSGAKSGQAYWAGKYVFYSGNMIYQSADGERWEPVE